MGTSIIATLLAVLLVTGATRSLADDDVAQTAKVTVLSSNLANGATTGEWGVFCHGANRRSLHPV